MGGVLKSILNLPMSNFEIKSFEFIQSLNLSDYGSWASIVSLFISFITLLLVASIKKKFLFSSRIEEHHESLSKLASELVSLIGNYESNINEIDNLLAVANIKLRNIQRGATDDLLSDIKKARKKITYFKIRRNLIIDSFAPRESNVRRIYTSINIVVEEMINVKKELLIGN